VHRDGKNPTHYLLITHNLYKKNWLFLNATGLFGIHFHQPNKNYQICSIMVCVFSDKMALHFAENHWLV
jgi:hypothetical protein